MQVVPFMLPVIAFVFDYVNLKLLDHRRLLRPFHLHHRIHHRLHIAFHRRHLRLLAHQHRYLDSG